LKQDSWAAFSFDVERFLKNSLFAAQNISSTILKFASLQIQKLAVQAQTLNLQPFRFTKNGYRKNLNSRSELVSPVFQRSRENSLTIRRWMQ
jgi:hypothetical protein